MGMDGLVPTFSVNGDGNGYNGGGWGDAVGAFAGALIGSWLRQWRRERRLLWLRPCRPLGGHCWRCWWLLWFYCGT